MPGIQFPRSSAASEGFPLLLLGGTFGQKMITQSRTVKKEAAPALTEGSDDALSAIDAYFRRADTLGKADV
jgi:hypothetical protein